MFNAQIKLVDDKQARYNVVFYTDTLFEAEIYLTSYLSYRHDTEKLILIYEYDLIYSIWDGECKIGTAQLVMGD